jgi:hypothetical protein
MTKNGFYQITLEELLDVAGGKKYVAREDDPYTTLMQAQEDYIDGLLTLYGEVGEVDPTEVVDWCDNLP